MLFLAGSAHLPCRRSSSRSAMLSRLQRLLSNLLGLFFPPEEGKEGELMPWVEILIPGGFVLLLIVALASWL